MNKNALKPDDSMALYKSGREDLQQGNLTGSIEKLQKAVALRPMEANYHNALGYALVKAGKVKEAEAHLMRAVKLDAGLAMAWQNLGMLQRDMNNTARACESFTFAAILEPTNSTFLLLFMEVFSRMRFKAFAERVKNVLIFCLKSEKVPHQILARSWGWFFEVDPAFEKIRTLDPDAKATGVPNNLDDLSLNLALQKIYVCTIEFERHMTKLRRFFLLQEGKGKLKIGEHQSFLCNLATQCWLNEYIYDVGAPEKKALNVLKEKIEAGIKDTPDYIAQVCLYACYESLFNLKNAKQILKKFNDSGAFSALLKNQIAEPLEELEIRETIAAGSKITNAVSKKVREQYEENPYPRWKHTTLNGKPNLSPYDILIAGCGTGQQTAITALTYPEAKIHNVDLSLASLAYAVRQTKIMGLDKNLTFEQADILELGKLGKQFDMIECVGVLHHMQKPEDGLATLKKLLKPDGTLSLGLYSEIGRRDIVAVRDYIAKEKSGTKPEDIRTLRQKIANHADPAIAAVSTRSDFYSMSACRDLILHVQEHRYTIPKIQKMLEDQDLVFQEFYFPRKTFIQIFKTKYPDEKDVYDLEKWAVFENEMPTFFSGMYTFKVKHA